MTPIGPIKLKVTKGLATIRAGVGADGAEVMLRVGDLRRVLPPLPVRLEVETYRKHILIARKKGFGAFEEPITFEDGQAEKTIEITMTESSSEAAPAHPRQTPKNVSEPGPASEATLSITSTPPSNILLDGKPLGTTPLRGISVEPGTHRVIFIHGAQRKSQSVEASAGRVTQVSAVF